ncbi:MAG: pilus assembly protein PilM [Candidatus Omnitrophota bacterium]
MFKKKQKDTGIILSIDIGSDAVRLVQGVKLKGGISILDFAQKSFLTECPPEELIINIQKALSSIFSSKKLNKETVHTIISGRKLCIRVITLPVIPEQELRVAVRSKVRKYVAPEVDEVHFQYSILGEKFEGGVKKIEVMFVAIQKSFFDDYLRLFAPLDIHPQLITSVCFGGWDLVRFLGLHKSVSSIMLVNINGQETDLTVYKDERFIFTRNIAIGVKEIIDTVKENNPLDMQSPALIQRQLDILCKEIELTSTHFYQIMHGQRIDKCIVLGEGGNVRKLIDYLKQKIEIPVSTLEITPTQLQIPKDKNEEFRKNISIYSRSLGALLSEPDEINLIGKIKKKKVVAAMQSLVSSTKLKNVVIIIISIIAFLYGSLQLINFYYKGRIAVLKKRQSSSQEMVAQLMKVKRTVDTLEAKKNIYLKLTKEYPSYLVIIDQISQAIPSESIVLDELDFTSGATASRLGRGSQSETAQVKFSIRGRMVSKDMTGSDVTHFVSALEQSGYFENVSVVIKGRSPVPGEGFDSLEPTDRRSAQGIITEEVSFIIDGYLSAL